MTRSRLHLLTYQQVADDYKLILCTATKPSECKRRYSGLKHIHGYADSMGIIHWESARGNRVTRPGLRKFLMLVAEVLTDAAHDTTTPEYRAIWLRSVWATKEAKGKYHTRLNVRLSDPDRERVLAAYEATNPRLSLRSTNQDIDQWIRAGTRLRPKGSHATEPEQPTEQAEQLPG